MQRYIAHVKKFNNPSLTVPSDKSISHRGVMFGALAAGKTTVYNPLLSDDIYSTVDCMERMGARVSFSEGKIEVCGAALNSAELYAGNSGTTMRLLCGVLSSRCGETFTLSGDESLSKRPMKRVCEPLALMGADIESVNGYAPLKIKGRRLNGITYQMPVDSAQVKSAIILASLNAFGETKIIENIKSRDHSEIMLKKMGANIRVSGNTVYSSASALRGADVFVPGDISSAAYPMVLAAAKEGNYVRINRVGINPSRAGIISVLKSAGVKIDLTFVTDDGEPVADIEVEGAKKLKAFKITKDMVPALVDEIPVLAVLACFCEGETVISGAQELKVKESNRITATVNALKTMGADIEETPDGMIVRGKALSGGGIVETFKDHRIAMSMAVAAALSKDGATILDPACVNISYPFFYDIMGLI